MPADLDVYLICDNYGTHKTPEVKRRLLRHPRFHLRFTPTSSSRLNVVERWFAELTNRKLRRPALVEPAFAQFFARFGRHLNYRGHDAADTEVKLMGAVHNLAKRLDHRRRTIAAAA